MPRGKKKATAPVESVSETQNETQDHPAAAPVRGDEIGTGGVRPSGEPVPQDDRGDISRNVVEWRKKNWPASQFSEVYPDIRLQAADLADLI